MATDLLIRVPLGDPSDAAGTRLWVRLTIADGMLRGMRVEDAPGESRPERLPNGYADVEQALVHWGETDGEPFDWTAHPGFPATGTHFQRAVWSALCRLRWGEWVNYGELARRAGYPAAARAVGQAVRANPWAPLVPCHRVLAAGGRLGGYAQGSAIKSRLLDLEEIAYR